MSSSPAVFQLGRNAPSARRPFLRAILIASTLTLAAVPALAADPVEGEWLTQGGSGKVRIAPCAGQGGRMCGVISWLRDPGAARVSDSRNPDAKLKDRPLMGLPMLWGFKAAGPGKWTGGRIYDPGSGKTYDSKISVNPNGTLKVEGCIAIVCQAQTWKRS